MSLRRRVTGGRAAEISPSIPILTYHSVDDSGGVLSTPVQTFRRHLATLYEMGLVTPRVSDIAACLRAQKGFPAYAIVLTFDDGFASVYEHAFPLLCRYGFSATVFLVTDYCGRLNGWPGQPPEIARLPLLQWAQIREMSRGGIHFGAHTKTHPDLRRLPAPEMEKEVCDSKRAIEDRLGQPVETFAYPYGHLDPHVLAVVREHFTGACSTELNFVREKSNPWCLERLDAYYLRPHLFLRYLKSPLVRGYLRARRVLRAIRHSRPLADAAQTPVGGTATAA